MNQIVKVLMCVSMLTDFSFTQNSSFRKAYRSRIWFPLF
jgi:hypothetical protein